MSAKSKQTKTTKGTESDFNLKDFKLQVETLVQRLMTFTLRNTALDAAVPSDRDTAESLYEQILQGFAILSEVDCYVGTKTNELARYMSRLTENHHKLNAQVDVEPEPPAEENLAGTEVNNEENSDEDSPAEEKKSKSKAPTKKKQETEDEEEEEKPPVEEKKSKSKSKSKKQTSDDEDAEKPLVEEKKSKSKSKKQTSDDEEEEKPKKPKGKKN